MSDDTAPPREAVDLIELMTPLTLSHCRRVLLALRTLPDAALWRLIAWLAAGREPTREMVEAGLAADGMVESPEAVFRAALSAAAQEQSDG